MAIYVFHHHHHGLINMVANLIEFCFRMFYCACGGILIEQRNSNSNENKNESSTPTPVRFILLITDPSI